MFSKYFNLEFICHSAIVFCINVFFFLLNSDFFYNNLTLSYLLKEFFLITIFRYLLSYLRTYSIWWCQQHGRIRGYWLSTHPWMHWIDICSWIISLWEKASNNWDTSTQALRKHQHQMSRNNWRMLECGPHLGHRAIQLGKKFPTPRFSLWRGVFGPHIYCPHFKITHGLVLNLLTHGAKGIRHIPVSVDHRKKAAVL